MTGQPRPAAGPGAAPKRRLRQRLLARIEAEGAITFADFMEAALYDPDGGFYTEPPVGADKHFVTSPHVSRAFGALVARQIAEAWEMLKRPDEMPVVEAGAGDGTLAAAILSALRPFPDLAAAVRYTAVERSRGARAALAARGIATAGSIAEAGPGIRGVVLANELLDNLPFHRLRNRDGRLVEVWVGEQAGRFVEIEDEPSAGARGAMRIAPAPGEERIVSPAAAGLVREIAATMDAGYAIFFDYAFDPADAPSPVRAYRRQRSGEDVLEGPGTRDITAGADLDALALEARAAGLAVYGPVTQRAALLALGLGGIVDALRARQREAEQEGRARDALRFAAERGKAAFLADPERLGSLRAIALAAGGLGAPALVREST